MRHSPWFCCCVVGLLLPYAGASEVWPQVVDRVRWAAAPITETSVFVGQRQLPAEAWDGIDRPVQVGLELQGRTWQAPVEIAVAYLQAQGAAQRTLDEPTPIGSASSQVQTDVLLQEVDVGALIGWEWWRCRVSAGGGPAWARGDVHRVTTRSLAAQIVHLGEPARSEERRTAIGLGAWTSAAATLRFGRSALGVQVRHAWLPLASDDGTVPAGGVQMGALVAFRW